MSFESTTTLKTNTEEPKDLHLTGPSETNEGVDISAIFNKLVDKGDQNLQKKEDQKEQALYGVFEEKFNFLTEDPDRQKDLINIFDTSLV